MSRSHLRPAAPGARPNARPNARLNARLNARPNARPNAGGTKGPTLRMLAVLAVLALVAVACGSEAPAEEPGAFPDEEVTLSVAVASFDLSVGTDQRLMAGVFTSERQLLGFGEVTFQLGFLGEQAGGEAALTQQATATFLPIVGMEPEGDSATPILLEDPRGSGVYAAQVDLEEAGFWGLRVLAELDDGRTLEGQASFSVLAEPQVPAVGDEAPRTVNLTLADVEAGNAEAVALDSRAQGEDATVPDQHLHDTTVAASIEAGRPVVVIVATPVYCASRFCGPLTDTLAVTALDYQDRADFVHLEVWEDFDAGQLNAAAAEFIQTETGGNEPWVFLIGTDGRITARWDNVLDLEELEAELDALPTLP